MINIAGSVLLFDLATAFLCRRSESLGLMGPDYLPPQVWQLQFLQFLSIPKYAVSCRNITAIAPGQIHMRAWTELKVHCANRCQTTLAFPPFDILEIQQRIMIMAANLFQSKGLWQSSVILITKKRST